MRIPKVKKITIKKKHFKVFTHVNFIIGILYAFYHYIRTPKAVDMGTRRLWAAETWIIFTLYSIFIYLFSIEVATENGEPIFFKLFKIKRSIVIRKPKEIFEKILQNIENNPKRYSFDTHSGIIPIKGKITEEDSIFQTVEKFGPVRLRLDFVTLGRTDKELEFKLVKPLKNLEIVGEFSIEEVGKNKFKLFLTIYSENPYFLNHIFLAIIFISPIRVLISKQLMKELRFIKDMSGNM